MSLAELLSEEGGAATAAPPTATLPRDHLSASSLSMFSRCPEQWRRVYMLGERQRPGAALIWGAADHSAHELNFRQKIDSHEDLKVDDVRTAFADAFDRKVEREGGTSEIEWGNDQPGDMKDKGVALVTVYHNHVSPRVQPVAVESDIAIELPGVPVPIIGRIDVTTAVDVVERKTAARKDTLATKPQWRLQGSIYAIATGLPVSWHVAAKTKLPAVYTPFDTEGLRLEPTVTLMTSTELRIQRTVWQMLEMIAKFGPDETWPSGAPDYGWACGYCGFRPTCAHWGETR